MILMWHITGSLTVGIGGAASSRAYAIPLLNTINYAAGTIESPNTGYFAGGTFNPTTINLLISLMILQ